LLNKIKYKKINNKDFILQTPEYSGSFWKNIAFTTFIKYSRVIKFVAFDYFEKWQYEKWVNLLLNYQDFIDSLINKWDMDFVSQLVLITIHNININAIAYFNEHYELSNSLKNKIYNSLEWQNFTWMIENWLKWEYKTNLGFLEEIRIITFQKNSSDSYYNYYKWIIEYNLFFSPKETKVLIDKKFHEIISTQWENKFTVEKNLNNYVGRYLYSTTDYASSYKKEENMIKLRNDILEKLKTFE